LADGMKIRGVAKSRGDRASSTEGTGLLWEPAQPTSINSCRARWRRRCSQRGLCSSKKQIWTELGGTAGFSAEEAFE